MSTTPPHWKDVALGDVIERIEAGRSFGSSNRPALEGEWGIIKVSAMTYGHFRAGENKAVPTGVPYSPQFEIRPGDLLISRANTRDYVGASVLVGDCPPRLLLSDKSLRLHPKPGVNARWLWYALSAPASRDYLSNASTGTKSGMRNISQQALRDLPLAVPAIDEQRRIVEILEDHLSRIDSAEAGLTTAQRRLKALHKSVLLKLIPDVANYPADWQTSTVEQAGKVGLGRQLHPDWHTGPNMKLYLRVANVFEDRIDTRSVYEMHWPGDTFDRFRLVPGDVLLNEGQTPELLGRPALYRGQPAEVAFTNSLLRFRATEAVLPEFALLVFRRHMHAGRFTKESRITTNIAHLSAARLKPIEFPIPPMHVQRELVNRADEQLSALTHLGTETAATKARAAGLRRALLGAAFSGRLTGASSDIDHIEELAGV